MNMLVSTVHQTTTRVVSSDPGDGTRYSVHITTITEGADQTDRVLLVSVGRDCAAFQCPSVAHRLRETERWTQKRAKELGAEWAWNAAQPLLHQLGVVRKTKRSGVVDVHLHEPEEGQ